MTSFVSSGPFAQFGSAKSRAGRSRTCAIVDDEAVHLPAVDVGLGRGGGVWAALLDVVVVGVRLHARRGGSDPTLQTVGTPFFIGIPSAPGYVPK